MDFVSLDFETANSSYSSICSIGLAVVKSGSIIESKHYFVKPFPNRYDSINRSIHGISNKITDSEPTFDKVWNKIKKHFNNQTMLAHNAAFDFGVLRAALDAYDLSYPNLSYHCTMRLSKVVLNIRDHKLDTISKHFQIQLNHHDAESDAIAAAQIAICLSRKMNVQSLDQLSSKLGFRAGRINGNSRNYESYSMIK